MREVSVVVPAFERPQHLEATLDAIFSTMGWDDTWWELILVDDGGAPEIKALAVQFDVRYYRLERETRWKNPGQALNVGIRAASGEFTIICHSGIVPREGTLKAIVERLETQDVAALARVYENGAEVPGSHRPYFLCGGIRTRRLLELRGYDEDFTEYGYEDDDLAARLTLRGVAFERWGAADHLPHARHAGLAAEMERMREVHYHKMAEMCRGQIDAVRNVDRDWGSRT